MTTPTGAEQLFWSEIRSDDSTRRSVAVCYALLIASNLQSGKEFWAAVDTAVAQRFAIKSAREFRRFQDKAKMIYAGAAAAVCPKFQNDEGKAA